jgi:poly-gamma-glutamate synthesis protein (capsule biosynthesis protein)
MSEIRLTLAGDIFPADMDYTIGLGIRSKFSRNKGNHCGRYLQDIFKDSDISFANLESPLMESMSDLQKESFVGDFEFASFLKMIGIDILSIANNHILEHGETGFVSTLRALEDNDLKYVGLNNNGLSNVVTYNIKDISIGFAAFNQIQNIRNPGLYADFEEKYIFNTIDYMHGLNLDFKILSFHWGDEYIHIPSYNQIKLAHAFIDRGVDIIIGHHPHVFQPIERYKNGLIIYSLGNCIFDMLFSRMVKTGMIVNVQLSRNHDLKYTILPIILSDKYFFRKGDPQSLKKYYSKMKELYIKGEKKYQCYYRRIHQYNHIYQRFLMKIYLLNLLIKQPVIKKKCLLRNIKKHIASKMGKK